VQTIFWKVCTVQVKLKTVFSCAVSGKAVSQNYFILAYKYICWRCSKIDEVILQLRHTVYFFLYNIVFLFFLVCFALMLNLFRYMYFLVFKLIMKKHGIDSCMFNWCDVLPFPENLHILSKEDQIKDSKFCSTVSVLSTANQKKTENFSDRLVYFFSHCFVAWMSMNSARTLAGFFNNISIYGGVKFRLK
jgi:hypothetical protein